MIVANIRSNADLQAKKDLQKQLLDLEISNEALKEQRQKESGNKDLEAKKLPDYKTSAEVLKDKVSLEKKALDNILELGFNYTDAGQLVNWITSQNRLADFTTGFKGIKKDLTEDYDKSILSTDFVKNYLDNYFIDLDANLGKRFSREIGSDSSKGGVIGMEDLINDLPTEDDINRLKDNIMALITYNPDITALGELVIGSLNTYNTIIPDKELQNSLINLTQNERIKLVRRYRGLLNKSQYISRDEMVAMNKTFAKGDVNQSKQLLVRIARQLSFLTPQTLGYFIKMQEDLIKTTIDDPASNYEKLQKDLEIKKTQLLSSEEYNKKLMRAEERELKLSKLSKEKQNELRVFVREEQEKLEKQITAQEYAKIVRDENLEELTREERLYLFPTKGLNRTFAEISEIRITGLTRRMTRKPEDIEKLMGEDTEELKVRVPHKRKTKNKPQNRTLRNNNDIIPVLPPTTQKLYEEAYEGENIKLSIDPLEGRGMRRRELRPQAELEGKGAEYLPKKDRDAIYSGLKKMGLGSGKVDKNTFKFLGNAESWHDAISGVGFKASRIPVSKVGKGVKLEKEDNPTYRQFGKYVIHIPHLLTNKTANFKYPSLGSIPTIKPLTISDDYKDLLLDVLHTGKLNKKELERLPQNEIKHFERVAVGAGLVEQLGLKIGNTEEDKADAKRFELLRGEYLAGNNNDKMIKELRQLITKFINTGRIHKTEGLNLLLELSTL